jgi:hypothetical protein
MLLSFPLAYVVVFSLAYVVVFPLVYVVKPKKRQQHKSKEKTTT